MGDANGDLDNAGHGRDRYLFIRVLEACNADCFMCEYALSRDSYRFTVAEFRELLPRAWEASVRYVRFTGGEPLMHQDIGELIRLGARQQMKMSVITNGFQLPRMAESLADAGLAQVIVSIDGSSADTHDLYRRTPGIFDRAVEGLRRCRDLSILTRVNTVVGPHNYTEMPALQRVLSDLGVGQWELSALKLDRSMVYPSPDDVVACCDPVYEPDDAALLVPLGKRFYGDTAEERAQYFERSVPPRAGRPVCHVVDDVVYLDAKQGVGYACSCLPHRGGVGGAVARREGRWWLDTPAFRAHAEQFRGQGPVSCQGCSTTAAGYSDDVARLGRVPEWNY
ncbi:cytosylglucuronate decarboxylase [Streptomyces sp. NPDC002514]|uniref:cytosylglucuronate decarboxylase n=1 Tax=Streptomyces sp. NPDC001270 TaxID=3364554 RepID=UPI0036BC2DFC